MRPWIVHYSRARIICFVDDIDELALMIALAADASPVLLGRMRTHHVLDLFERLRTVYVGIALAEQIQIRPVQQQDRLRIGHIVMPFSGPPMPQGAE